MFICKNALVPISNICAECNVWIMYNVYNTYLLHSCTVCAKCIRTQARDKIADLGWNKKMLDHRKRNIACLLKVDGW